MATSSSEAYVVPGVAETNNISRGSVVALFVKGLEAYDAARSGTVMVKGKSGDPVEAVVLGAQPGRLYQLAQQFMGQSPSAMASYAMPGGGNFADVAFFNSLEEQGGEESVHPLASYTVLLIRVDQQVPVPTPTTSAGTSA